MNMIIFMNGKAYATLYNEENFQIFRSEGTPVLVFDNDEDIEHLNLEYEWA